MDDHQAKVAIEHLMYRYAECVDLARFSELGELFAHATLRADVSDGSMRGVDDIRDFYAATNRVHDTGTLCTRHLSTNVVIEVDIDARRATALSCFTVLQATPRLALQPIVTGRYADVFEHVDGRWRFADRMVLVDQIGDMSEHLSIDLRTERVVYEEAVGRPLGERG